MIDKRSETFGAVVRHYRRWRDDRAKEESWWAAKGLSFSDALDRAAHSRLGDRKHDHQQLIPPATLDLCAARLSENSSRLEASRGFDDLLGVVHAVLNSIHGAGEMVTYDIADRLGLHLGLPPQRIYLHRGTRDGAKALGLWRRGLKSIELHEFHARYPEFRDLSAREAEDVLCIYKGVFAGLEPLPPIDQRSCGSRKRRRGC
jgi:hypothetical protein